MYGKKIEEYLNKGYASQILKDEYEDGDINKIWYLPYFGVVFDTAVKVNGKSEWPFTKRTRPI